MYEFWYDYKKLKCVEKTELYYMDADNFIRTDDICKNFAEDIETRFDTSTYELDRALQKGKDNNVIGLAKYEWDRKIMAKIDGLRPKNYSYLLDDGSEDKISKGTKNCAMKRKITFENYTNCSEVTQLENKINHLEKKKQTEIDHFKKISYL